MWRGNRAGPSRDGVPGGAACGPGDGPQGEAGAVTRPSGRASKSTTPLANGTPAAADSADADRRPGPVAAPAAGAQVPGWLQRAAGWSWRLLLLGVVIYLAFRVATVLRLVVLPCVAALLLTALLQPLLARLRRLGLPNLAATWCTLLVAIAVLAGAGFLATTRASADYPTLVNELRHSVNQLQSWLAGPPLHLRQASLNDLANRALAFLKQHKSMVAGTVVTGGKIVLEIVAGTVLMLFVTFFLLKDGASIWHWLIHGMAPEARRRMAAAGDQAWRALVNYMRGTTVVAAIHSVLLGLAMWILGVPLVVPLIVLVFIAAYIPLIGILVVGGLAILIALATKGWVAAVLCATTSTRVGASEDSIFGTPF